MHAVALIQVVTGFAMYGQSRPGGLWYTLFGWIVPRLGGIQMVRVVHHVRLPLALVAAELEHNGFACAGVPAHA